MRKSQRGHAEVRGIVDASIDEILELLTDLAACDRGGRRGTKGARSKTGKVWDGL
ncbi:hypothetical protein B0G57_12779 [Trinickia symbiotica]|nr:hypothetical protein B0G57_12779 [Trinickia symbiotica]